MRRENGNARECRLERALEGHGASGTVPLRQYKSRARIAMGFLPHWDRTPGRFPCSLRELRNIHRCSAMASSRHLEIGGAGHYVE